MKISITPVNHHDHKHDQATEPRAGSGQVVTDPVCGMTIDPKTAAGSYEHNGTTYYFCNSGCLARFKENPEMFLSTQAHEPHAAPAVPGTQYICPMDPEVRQGHPGACPIVERQ